MDILGKEYFTRRGRAQEAFRTRAKSRGRLVTSDRPPPRRCGQAAWAAAGRLIFDILILNDNISLSFSIGVHLHGKRYTRIVQFLNHHQ